MHKKLVNIAAGMVKAENTISYFYDQLAKSILVGVKCRKCGKLYVPPRPLCTKCYTRNLRPVKLSGEGEVQTFTIIHIAPPEFQPLAPYTVAVVSLREGVSVLGMLKNDKMPQGILGVKVVVDFESSKNITPGTVRLVFKPLS